MKAYLKDNEGLILFMFEQTAEYFDGVLKKAEGYNSDKTVESYAFVANAMVKWDGCSHWNFFGEDYVKGKDTEINSYYHICGFRNYINFIIGMLFVFKIAETIIPSFDFMEREDFRMYEHLLDDYEIEISYE